MTPFEKIEFFKSKCISAFGERLECLIITGSYARGDYTPQSDIDLWVLINNLRLEDIQKVGEIVSQIGKPSEINPQCSSFADLKLKAFKEQFNPVQLYVDGIVLHGSLPAPVPAAAEISNYASSIAVFVMMNARHFISVQESEESLAENRLKKWIINPFMWVLRYKVFCKTSKYPRKIEELMNSLSDVREKEIVQIYERRLSGVFQDHYKETVEKVEILAEEFILNEK